MSDAHGSGRTVRLILDTSAIEAWTRGSVSVGELIAEIDVEYGAVIVPSACLVEAAARNATAHDWIDVLTRDSASYSALGEGELALQIADD